MWNPFRRKEQRSAPMAIDELLSYLGVSNTGAGEFVSPNTAESLPAVMSAVMWGCDNICINKNKKIWREKMR